MASIAMTIPSVFAIVLVAAAGAASAEPDRISYGDTKAPDKHAPGRDNGWTQLATPTPASHGSEFIVVGKEQGRFDKLRIAADKGTVIVRRVKIYFEDGKEKVVNVDSVLGPKHKSTDIELKAPAEIDRVVITTEPQGKGEYALYGSSGEGVASR
jgi:hypothetical protein